MSERNDQSTPPPSMPDHPSPRVEAWCARVDDLARRVLIPLRNQSLDKDQRASITAGAKDAGIFAMTQPDDSGGQPVSSVELTAVRERLGRHDVGHLPGLFGPRAGLLAEVEAPLRRTHLAPLLAGLKTSGFAFTEPADAVRHTWAAGDGDHFVVTGQKSYVTGGADADFVVALVEVDDSGPAMLVIDLDSPGVTLERRFGSLDGSHHAAFSFDAVRVPRAHLVGSPGRGLHLAARQVGEVRLAIAANCVGLCGYVLDELTRVLAEPAGDGMAPATSERVRLRYGDLRIRAYAARSALYRTASLVDTASPLPDPASPLHDPASPLPDPASPAGDRSAGPTDPFRAFMNEIMATKVIATETIGDIVDEAIQLVGGQAVALGHPFEGVFRRVRSARLAEGPSDVLRTNVARGALDLGIGRI